MSTTVTLGNGDTGLPDGTVIADEVVAGEHFQKVKLIDPTVGSAAPIGVAANPVRTAPVGSTSVDDGGGSLTVDGTVAVGNFPATQPVSGTVAVNNFPATQPVSGTFFQATQPVSAATLPLPAGAAQDGTDITTPSPAMPAGGAGIRGWLSAIWTKLNASLAVTGTFWQATQPVSGTFFQAIQPVSGTFFQATQPVSGTVTANIGTAGTLALDATLTGGTQRAKITDGTNNAALASANPAGTEQGLIVRNVPIGATAVSSVLQTTANTAQASQINLAAPGAGLFHYITSIVVTRVNNTVTAIAADTTARSVTSANLGGWAHEVGSTLAAGGAETFTYLFPNGLRSAVANTATTLSTPAGGTGTKIRVTVTYYTGQ